MVRHINTDWHAHVATTGVTCYTCHRGQPVPANVWFTIRPFRTQADLPATNDGMGHPEIGGRATALPLDPFTPFLEAPARSACSRPQALPAAGWERPSRDREDLRVDDWMSEGPRSQLHLLPQHARILAMAESTPAARDRVARHPDGAGIERHLSRSAQGVFPPNRLGRWATDRRWTARRATRASTSRCLASASPRIIRSSVVRE